jgi:integrase
MRAIIGAKLLTTATCRPAPKPFEIRDSRLPGFILRIQPSGARSYYAQHGRGRRTLIGAVGQFTPDEARERCQQILGNVAHGRPPLHAVNGADAGPTLGEFIGKEGDTASTTYRAWLNANRPKSAATTLQRLETQFGAWYPSRLTDITVEKIEAWRTDRLTAGRSTTTVLRDVMTLSGVLSRAVRQRKLAENPVRHVEKPRLDRAPKVRYLDDAEEKRLREALEARDAEMRAARESGNEWRKARKHDAKPALDYGDHLTPAVLLSMNTGLRQGELVAIKWANIDFKGAQLTVEGSTSKSQQTRHIPLNSEAVSTLKRWRRQSDGDRVFPISRLKTSWAALLERAHITGFRWHDLRHHFASRLVQQAVPLNTVRELLGHGSLAMTLRYAHLAPDQKVNAVAKLVRT